MKTVSDVKLYYLVEKLLGRISGGEDRLLGALKTHLEDRDNPHGVSLSQLLGSGGAALLNAVYPVGAIYISTRETSPAVLFGGSWERIQDRFLLAAGANNAGTQGGAAAQTLTAAQLPRHSHLFHIGTNGSTQAVTFDKTRTALNFNSQKQYATGALDITIVQETGENQSFSTMPPYVAVYMWQRTA